MPMAYLGAAVGAVALVAAGVVRRLAVRSLVNAARLVEGSPALAQLRLLQHLATTSGNTYVLGPAVRGGAAAGGARAPDVTAGSSPASAATCL